MGFGKSFGIGLVVYIAINFILNMVLVLLGAGGGDIGAWFSSISSEPLGFCSALFAVQGTPVDLTTMLGIPLVAPIGGWLPGSLQILLGIFGGVTSIQNNELGLGIVAILAGILPGLITAIVAGKLSDTPKKGFGAMLLIGLIAGIALGLFSYFDAANTMVYNPIALIGGISSDYLLYVLIGSVVIGLFWAMFWSGIAAVLGYED